MGKKKSKKKINALLEGEIGKARALGYELKPIKSEVAIYDSKSAYGFCKESRGKCTIVLSSFMRKRPKAEIKAVLMHEVLHAVKGNKGHGPEWKACVREVKNTFDYKGFEDCHLCEHPYSKKRPAPKKRKKEAGSDV